MRAQTIFATLGGLKGETGDRLRQWMRDNKQYEDSPTLDPKAVCERAGNVTYMLYQHLSWDAHPSMATLKRYYVPPNAEGVPGIDVDPIVQDAEIVEMAYLVCPAVIAVFLGVGDLLGNDNAPTAVLAAEYMALADRTRRTKLSVGS